MSSITTGARFSGVGRIRRGVDRIPRFDGGEIMMHSILGATLVWGAALLLLGCAGSGPATQADLDASATKVELIEFAGHEPERCVFSAPSLELCSWRLGESDRGWAVLAEPLGAHSDVNLVCEIPIDGSPRAEGSCSGYALAASKLPAVSAPAGVAEARREAAAQRLAAARTVRELSDLLGDAPDKCLTGMGVQTCAWSLSEEVAGYELVAALATSPGALELRCLVPLDGSPRASDSCTVEEAD
ncbi:MAG: hypothetical protein V3U03_13980 [Myxococcota bacterium]